MTTVDGPVSMTVKYTAQLDATTAIAFETEFVVTSEEAAAEKGDQFNRLMASFTDGFSAATREPS